MPSEKAPVAAPPSRWTLTKDLVSFQFKLVIDGFRDFILVPVSLIVGIVSLVRPGDLPGTGFYRLLQSGRDTEKWINLFGAADRLDPSSPTEQPLSDIDALLQKVETFAVNEYKSGDLSRQAKEHFDKILQSLRAHGKSETKGEEP